MVPKSSAAFLGYFPRGSRRGAAAESGSGTSREGSQPEDSSGGGPLSWDVLASWWLPLPRALAEPGHPCLLTGCAPPSLLAPALQQGRLGAGGGGGGHRSEMRPGCW